MNSDLSLFSRLKFFRSMRGNGVLLLSFSCYKALSIIVFTQALLFGNMPYSDLPFGPQVVVLVACTLVCIFAAAFFRSNNSVFSQKWYTGFILTCMLVGLALLFVIAHAGFSDMQLLAICSLIAIAVFSLGFMGIHIELGRIFGYLGSFKTLTFGTTSACLAVLLYAVSTLFEGIMSWGIVALYATLATVLYYCATNKIGRNRVYDDRQEKQLLIPYKFMITAFILGFSFGFVIAGTGLADNPTRPYSEIIAFFGASILTVATVLIAHVDFNRAVYRIGFPLIAAGMLITGVFGDILPGSILQLGGYIYIDLVLWALGSYLMKDRNQPATWVAACPTGALMFGKASGITASWYIPELGPMLVFLIAAFLIVVSALYLSSSRNIKTGWGFVRPGDTHRNTALDDACSIASQEFQLSPRETDIMQVLACGKNANEIAETLMISPNTVKTHIQNIYAKSGVHSRKELLRLIDSRKKLIHDHADDCDNAP